MTKIIVCFVAVFGCLLIYVCGSASPASNNANTSTPNTSANAQTKPTVVSDLTQGSELYNKNCAECHKESGEGGPTVIDGRKMKPDNLTDAHRTKMTDDEYIKVMVEGIEDEGMPSYKDKLSEAEMQEIVKYIRVGLQKRPDNTPVNANMR